MVRVTMFPRYSISVRIAIVRHRTQKLRDKCREKLAASILQVSLCDCDLVRNLGILLTNKMLKPTASCLHARKRALIVFRQATDVSLHFGRYGCHFSMFLQLLNEVKERNK